MRIDHDEYPDLISGLTGDAILADVRCPTCYEMVNCVCWNCGWRRDPEQRKDDLRRAASHEKLL